MVQMYVPLSTHFIILIYSYSPEVMMSVPLLGKYNGIVNESDGEQFADWIEQ